MANSQYTQEAQAMLRDWENGNTEVRSLWKQMNAWVMEGFDKTYKALGCEFDKFYFESDTYTLGRKYIEKGRDEGIFEERTDGAVWVNADRLKQAGGQSFKKMELNDKLLLRGDGTSVYMTQDIGTTILKNNDYDLNRCIFVVAEEQNLHFKILFTILKLLGFEWQPGCEHVAYGMVVLPQGMGKIKSREGTAVDADDLLDEMTYRAEQKIRASGEIRVPEEEIPQVAVMVALAALKFFILQVSLDRTVQFDPNKVIEFTGDTGPYIQYSYARIQGIFRKTNLEINEDVAYQLLNTAEEIELLKVIAEFPQLVATAAEKNAPNLVGNYLLALTKSYTTFYTHHKVLNEDDEDLTRARLLLCRVVAQVIKNGLELLGIKAVERM